VGGGDMPKAERIKTGLLGAQLERDPGSGYYRIKKILRGQNWDRTLRSPLTEIGVDATEGDYIIAVDGKSTKDMNNIYAALIGKAGKQVVLTVNRAAKEEGSRTTTVTPTDSELDLYYFNWVQTNIEKVNEATKGRVGYVHIPDMGSKGLNEFVKHYYPQVRKDGLIVDVRGNGGGNVSPQIVERLRREVAMLEIARNTAISLDPGGTLMGPKVMLIDEFSASDGDIVAYRFKKYNLGPVIGKRTWGGVVGIRGTLPLLDGGYLRRPEFSRYDLDGKEWIMEGIGEEPDIVVDNDPAKEYDGIDEQLNKAIDVILEELEKNPPQVPPPPPYPDKSK
jgi:tricorn protease